MDPVDTRSDAERAEDEKLEELEGRTARDGEVDANELERRRQQKNGGSVRDRAEEGEGEPDEESDGQFAFVTEEAGKKVSIGTIIARGTPVEYRITMAGKSNVLKGALMDPADTMILMLVRGAISKYEVSYTRDDDEKITKVTVFVHIAPKHVLHARSEAARVLLEGEPAEAAAS